MSRLLITGYAIAAIIFFPYFSCAEAGTTTPADVQINALSIDQPLTSRAGNAESGRELFASREQGNCLACHANSDMAEYQFHGAVGPSLDGVSTRRTEGQLRTILVNAKVVFSERTIMPVFYSFDDDESPDSKTILTAQEIEDLVAYLVTLK